MLKRSYRCALLMAVGLSAGTPLIGQAQTIIGMGTDTPNPNAVLELVPENGNQGFLAPRLTSAQRNASSFTTKLTDADNGLLVFDTDQGAFFYWYQGEWHQGISNNQGSPNPISQGTTWYTGTTEPRGINAHEGDFYINESTGEVYKFSNLSFAIIGSLGESSAPSQTPNLSTVLQQDNSAAQQKITNLAEPTEADDAATKDYVDQLVGRTPPIVDLDNQSLSNVLGVSNDANRNKIINLDHPDNPRDAATKFYVDQRVPLVGGQDNQELSFNETTKKLGIERGGEVDLSSLDDGVAALPENQIFIGNTSSQATPVTITGDITIAANGAVTIQNARITTAKIADDAVTKDKISADVAGAGLSQAGDGSLQVDLTGDVTTSGNNLSIIKLQGNDVATTNPLLGQVITWDGAKWIPADVPPTGGGSTTPTISTGSGTPQNGEGKIGDIYIGDEDTVYIKINKDGAGEWLEVKSKKVK